jgi:hypothetical protein
LPAGVDFQPLRAVAGLPYCIRAAGFTNVKKLGGATPIAAETWLRRSVYTVTPVKTGTNYRQQRGYFLTKAMPATANALGFGFMPTMATADIQQVAAPGSDAGGLRTGNLRSDIPSNGALPMPGNGSSGTWARSYVAIRVKGGSVNGTPLPIGEKCATGPTLLSIYSYAGTPPASSSKIDEGSAFTAEASVPAFSGCGSGEDLSPLITASISGGGNQAKLEAGKWCANPATRDCTIPREPIYLTVKPGGPTAATATADPNVPTAGFKITGSAPGTSLGCDLAKMKLNLPVGHWQSRFPFAEVTGVQFTGCKYTSPAGSTPLNVRVVGEWSLVIPSRIDGVLQFALQNVLLNAEGTVNGKPCVIRLGDTANDPLTRKDVEVPSVVNADYDGRVLSLKGTLRPTVDTKCDPLPGFKLTDYLSTTGKFEFKPPQSITSP